MKLRTLALCLLAGAALAEDPAGFPASELKWAGCYGSRALERDVVYCLVGISQFGTPQAPETGNRVQGWLEGHPSAQVVVVWSFDPPDDGDSETAEVSKQCWVWITDGDANLAVDLVALGCWPAGVMAVPEDAEPLVRNERYQPFLAAVNKAEEGARSKRLGIWGNPALVELLALDRADRLREERKFAEAAAAYQEAIKAGADAEACWMSIAECREAMGEYHSTLAAYDAAIATGGIGALGAKAHCMSRYESPAVAAAWLQGLIDREAAAGDKAFLWSVLGLFHMEEDRPKEAQEPLRKALQMRCDQQAFRFDERDELVLDEPTSMKRADDFLAVAVAIEPLARCALKAGDLDEAFRVATRGVAIGRQWRRCEGRYAAGEVEAGDACCRSIRAIVHAFAGRFAEARKEASLARLLADRCKVLADREVADVADRVIREVEEKERGRTGGEK